LKSLSPGELTECTTGLINQSCMNKTLCFANWLYWRWGNGPSDWSALFVAWNLSYLCWGIRTGGP